MVQRVQGDMGTLQINHPDGGVVTIPTIPHGLVEARQIQRSGREAMGQECEGKEPLILRVDASKLREELPLGMPAEPVYCRSQEDTEII